MLKPLHMKTVNS